MTTLHGGLIDAAAWANNTKHRNIDGERTLMLNTQALAADHIPCEWGRSIAKVRADPHFQRFADQCAINAWQVSPASTCGATPSATGRTAAGSGEPLLLP